MIEVKADALEASFEAVEKAGLPPARPMLAGGRPGGGAMFETFLRSGAGGIESMRGSLGERGAELFVPTSSGRVETPAGGGVREVRVAITVNAGAGEAPRALAQSGRQVARAVKAALSQVE